MSELGVFCRLFLSTCLSEHCASSPSFLPVAQLCSYKPCTLPNPVNHVSLGASFSRHGHAIQLLGEIIIAVISLSASSNGRQIDCIIMWSDDCFAGEPGISLFTAFLVQCDVSFLLLLPKVSSSWEYLPNSQLCTCYLHDLSLLS